MDNLELLKEENYDRKYKENRRSSKERNIF